MKLRHVLDGASAFLRLERYVNEGSRTYSRHSGTSHAASRYQPRSDTPSFEVPTFMVPRKKVGVFEADPDRALRRRYLQDDHVLFRVHPETREELENREWLGPEEADPVAVAPTSSTRTVLTLEAEGEARPHFLKLHYPRRISRFIRRLRKKNIHNSVETSRELADIRLPRFAYLPESLGFTYGEGPAAWGFIVRETTPRPWRGEGRLMVPLFALYSGDLTSPEDSPLLVQMIRSAEADPFEFTLNEIMLPVIECWATVLLEKGLLLESHGQNLLLELDGRGRPQRLIHRDLDVWFDAEIRKQRGLPIPFLGDGIGGDAGHPREQYLSLIYDWFIGHHLFDYLAQVLQDHFAIDPRGLQQKCRAHFRGLFEGRLGWFPERTTFYFSDEPQPENECPLVDMGQPPSWR